MTALVTRPDVVAPAPLERRELLNLDRAVSYLAARVRARTPMGASEYLELRTIFPPETYAKRVGIAVSTCDLYRDLFPRQYGASGAPPYSLQREQELYVLAERHLFPLGGVDEVIRREPTFFMPLIPLVSMQPHDWREGCFDFGAIGSACRLAQVLSHRIGANGAGWRAMTARYGLQGCPAPVPPLGAVGWQLFDYACRVEDSPLCFLPAAFRLTDYSTGSAYLDTPPGKFMGFEWAREDVAKLVLHRREAEKIVAAVMACEQWLDEAPRERVARAVELWNRASEIEAQTRYAGYVGRPGEFIHVPEMRDLTVRMLER